MARSAKSGSFQAKLNDVGWIRLIILSILGVAGAWLSFALAVSGVTRIKNPQIALNFVPFESTALAARADQLFSGNPGKPSDQVRELALDALRHQAINAKALRLLGFFANAQGQDARSGEFVRMAENMSRREPGAQLWLIEASARKNDTPQALIHYDIVLRTRPSTQSVLFPRLLNAIEDTDIRKALIPYVRNTSGWGPDFLNYANEHSKNLPAVVKLILDSGGLADSAAARNQYIFLLTRLISEKKYSDARRLYLTMPDASHENLSDARFGAADRDGRYGPMGWQLLDDPDAGGGFSAGRQSTRPALTIFANAANTRPVATRLMYLAPGSYNFEAKLQKFDRGDGGYIRWQLRCPAVDAAQVIWILDSIGRSAQAKVVVPSDCPVQFLDIVGSGGNGQIGMEATISLINMIATP